MTWKKTLILRLLFAAACNHCFEFTFAKVAGDLWRTVAKAAGDLWQTVAKAAGDSL